MSNSTTRRAFLRTTISSAALLGPADVSFLKFVPPVSAADAEVDPKLVRLDSGIEPLVRFLEVTPRDKLLEEIAGRIKKGLSYQEVVTALFLAGVRTIRPGGGGNFHAVLAINAAHQASQSSPDGERWLPIFWSLDDFKRAQAVNANSWRMEPLDEAKVPSARKARQALSVALAKGDLAAAEVAVASLVRKAGAGEIFDQLAVHGAGNFGALGHPAIFVSHAWRALQCLGWQHAEPVLRSLARVVCDSPPEPLWKGNRELAARLDPGWQEGKPSPEATTDLLALMRKATPAETSQKVAELLKEGVAPQSIWDASFAGVAELLMRQPALPDKWMAGVFSLHSVTSMNALHYAYEASSQDETRRLLFLQGAALVPYFLETMGRRGGKVADGRIDQVELAPLKTSAKDAPAEIFADISTDRGLATRKALTYLKDNPRPQELIDAARLVVFLKGTDAHDYKFSTAVFEDYYHISPAWRNRYLANAMYILRGSADKDNALVSRTPHGFERVKVGVHCVDSKVISAYRGRRIISLMRGNSQSTGEIP